MERIELASHVIDFWYFYLLGFILMATAAAMLVSSYMSKALVEVKKSGQSLMADDILEHKVATIDHVMKVIAGFGGLLSLTFGLVMALQQWSDSNEQRRAEVLVASQELYAGVKQTITELIEKKNVAGATESVATLGYVSESADELHWRVMFDLVSLIRNQVAHTDSYPEMVGNVALNSRWLSPGPQEQDQYDYEQSTVDERKKRKELQRIWSPFCQRALDELGTMDWSKELSPNVASKYRDLLRLANPVHEKKILEENTRKHLLNYLSDYHARGRSELAEHPVRLHWEKNQPFNDDAQTYLLGEIGAPTREDLFFRRTYVDLSNLDIGEFRLATLSFPSVNFERSDFTAVDAARCDLHGSSLREATAVWSNFWDADLRRVDFWKADCRHCQLGASNLQEAWFCASNLQHANMYRTDFIGAYFLAASLVELENMTEAIGDEAIFGYCDFANARLGDQRLWNNVELFAGDRSSQEFADAVMQADRSKISMRNAWFFGCTFDRSWLCGIDFTGSSFIGCKFFNCDIRGSIFSDVEFRDCFADTQTIDALKIGQGIKENQLQSIQVISPAPAPVTSN